MAFISAGLAHDVGHELATVSCLAAAIRRDPALRPDSRRRLELIEQEVARVQDLVAVGCETDPVLEEVSLGALIAELVEPVALAGPTDVTARADADVAVTVDRTALWRLVGNLVGNAVRAAGPSGRVWVVVRDSPAPAIEVHDDGPGPAAGPPGRAGLGLSTARRLARRCGAVLTLAPVPEGGTVARVSFGRDRPDPVPRLPTLLCRRG